MVLEIKDISKKFDKQVLNDVSIKLEPGIYGLLGPNGAGKSTLMKITATLLKADSGSIYLSGEDIKKQGEKYLDILGYLPQDFGCYPGFTGYQMIEFLGRVKGMDQKTIQKRSEMLFREFDLYDARNKRVDKYSGGMKKRIGIIQAFINDPKILLLDEPTAGLDPIQRLHFKNYLTEQAKDKIILFSTHITEDIESICQKILLLKNGEIIVSGTEEEMISVLVNKIFEISIHQKNLKKFIDKYKVVNYKAERELMKVRFINDEKIENSHYIKPTLEDVYLFYNDEGKKDGDINARLS